MKKASFLLIVFMMLSIFLPAGPAVQDSQSANVLMGAAIHQEEVEGNYEAAIEILKKLLAEYPDNRPLAAQAQFRIGICYEKLGLKEAEKAFRQVVESYPDQTDLVKMAREKLAALAGAQAAALKGRQDIGLRKVWSGPGADLTGGISPDGRYFSFTDWTTGDLAVRDLTMGKNRRLTDKGPWTKSNAFALFSKWSPDGRSIAYCWWDPETETSTGHFEIRLIGQEGGQPRILYEHKVEPVGDAFPLDWQPDGKRILAYFGREDLAAYQLGLVSVADGTVQIIKEIEYHQGSLPMHYAYSPDGRFIAYDRISDRTPKNWDIFLLSSDGTQEHCLIDHPAADIVCDWTSDGRGLLFTSDRTGGEPGLWIASVEDGQMIGAPTLLKANMGAVDPFICTRQDQLFYGYRNSGTDIYMAEIDPDSGQFSVPPVKKARLTEGRNSVPACSPDGKEFVYISKRGFSTRVKYVLCVYSFDKDESRELDTGLKMVGMGSLPQWRPDGKAISLTGMDNEDRNGLFLYELESGKLSLLASFTPENRIYVHKWAKDGQTIFLSRGQGNKTSAIYARDLKTGSEEALSPLEETTRFFDLSPDGRQLVFLNRGEGQKRDLGLISTSGGDSRILHSIEVKENRPVIPAWSTDGKSIFFSYKADVQDNDFYMVRFSLEGGKAQRIEPNTLSFYYPSPHPDGRRIIFSTQREDLTEVWVIENFLPEKKD